jgi:phage terminase large subunit-like protein
MSFLKYGNLSIKWTDYIPHSPTPKQLAFLMLPHLEALYGGAAGGGKSDALLMGALQHVDKPGYSAIIFRRTLADLKQPSALIDRAFQWLQGTPAKWEGGTHTWIFPTVDAFGNPSIPARLTFGYIGESNAYLRYQGIEVQYCAFDEVTQHVEDDYRYLFSRLRKCVCPVHKTDEKKRPIYLPDCPLCQAQKSIPIKMRAATNPGGPGHGWVKRRFKIGPDIDLKEQSRLAAEGKPVKVRYLGKNPKRPFISSFAADNPYVDLEGYASALDELDPSTRAMLKEGRWDVSPDSRFKRHWAKYYSRRSDSFCLGIDGSGPVHNIGSFSRLFCVVDPAASVKHGPGDILTWKKEPSYTVIGIFGLTHDHHLLWLDMLRFRKEVPDIIIALKKVFRIWRPDTFYIEANGLGQGVYQGAIREGLPVAPVHTRVDKVVNATEAMIRMRYGRIWFPQEASWLETLEDELFFWTGDPIRTDDIVDVLSNAARQVAWDDPVIVPDVDGISVSSETNDVPDIICDRTIDSDQSPFYLW